MKTKNLFSKISFTVVVLVLIAAMALNLTACNEKPNDAVSSTPSVSDTADIKNVGEGDTSFSLIVTYSDGKTEKFNVSTNEKTVGAALISLGIIEGDEGPYGLYIKKVNGVVADYDIDGTYWSFYVDGAYASKSADQTEITKGSEYGFKVEK